MITVAGRCVGSLVFVLGLMQWVAATTLCTHNETFIPDAILRVTVRNISQSCLPAKMTVLVNGTAPGPELRLSVGKTYWIRVYNDMVDQNLTMVRNAIS
jgi:L-ascorbate oxidase